MDALAEAESIFSRLHSTVLKQRGFRKRGAWCVIERNAVLQTFHLRSSRFGTRDKAVFWIDVQVFSSSWYDLTFAPKTFPGAKERTPSLVSESLGEMCDPPSRSFEITSDSPPDTMALVICEAAEKNALPLLEQCDSLAGVLTFLAAKPAMSAHGIGSAGVCLLLGREADARHHIEEAKRLAPHENYRNWLELRERSMWAQYSKR